MVRRQRMTRAEPRRKEDPEDTIISSVAGLIVSSQYSWGMKNSQDTAQKHSGSQAIVFTEYMARTYIDCF